MPILFIDCYDSFTYNLVHLIEDTTKTKVSVIHNDSLSKDQLLELLPFADAVVVGPGPGHPAVDTDSGVIRYLWDLPHELQLPIFGVCFGLQSLCLAFGGEIKRLDQPQHGQYGEITHTGNNLFAGIPQQYKVIRYHSLHAVIENAPQLVPLAHCNDVLMGVCHTDLPYYAVQFHPESVLSEFGAQLIENFWKCAKEYNQSRGRAVLPDAGKLSYSSLHTTPLLSVKPESKATLPEITSLERIDPMLICNSLKAKNTEFVLLKSASYPGKWSIIGVLDKNTTHLRCKNDKTRIGPLHGDFIEHEGDFWAHVAQHMGPRIVEPPQTSDIPFWGGLVGYVTYEKACNVSCDPDLEQPSSDASFVFVENCILVGEKATVVISPDSKWHESTKTFLCDIKSSPETFSSSDLPVAHVSRPDKSSYIDKIERCFEYLRSGDSYELCLTAQTKAVFEKPVDSWDLFRHVLGINPAPYMSYMDFDDRLVGASPERFMSWDSKGTCQFRPIKGTVKKAPGITRADAEAILGSNKERAENLMIVDLIRHDLGLLLDTVESPLLMSVEEYKTVYQLVSVIEGPLNETPFSGLDVLVHSLPPGSMTGAPKLRSVEILRQLETEPRGLYSGVAGYWSITDQGDWSVTIRSAFQYKDYDNCTWRLGAGGAITILSDVDDEFAEMDTKLDSTLRAFQI
ncbi:Aminodeoxychorismate synthase [Wickerhamiella sorbophila]|uniref:aminodeoxychorismate synthase n=1 Tax=Wickerhamiella sorbophila TaxID=45607 RepID=A0A2T0FD75_9ASCO|nr:Aminodeoxychorismate synthase [Wickerhamiella sorbophila]PRT52958.1 Aminodeoxychorismate synthase [Wickerhamiella sorbophila]